MTEEEPKNEETTDAEATPDAEETTEPAAEQAPDAPAADPAPAEEVPAEEPPAEEPPADEEPAAGAPAAEAGPDPFEGLDWKARKRLERAMESGEAGPQRSPEERAAERAEARRTASRQRAANRLKQRKDRESGTPTPPAEADEVAARTRQGYVLSSKRDKTITVRIDSARRHPRYEKIVRRTDTLHAHDERNEAGAGDLVRVVETRPLSKTKRWRLVDVLEKAK